MQFPAGPFMRARREALGIQRSAIAVETRRSEEMVRRWERGINRPPAEVLVRVAAILDVPVARLTKPCEEAGA